MFMFLMAMSVCTPLEICEELRDMRPFKADRLGTCVEVIEAAEHWELDPVLLVATAWHESRFNNAAVSRSGAVGALQILPQWWCGSQKCDYIYNGGRAFKRWMHRARKKKRKLFWTLAYYNGGNRPGARSFRYAERVLNTAKRLRRRIGRVCNVPGC